MIILVHFIGEEPCLCALRDTLRGEPGLVLRVKGKVVTKDK